MKKSLVVLAALAATTAFAQSSVTLYGYGDQGLGRATAVGSKAELNPSTGDVSGIRIGLRGSEDLGGGMVAKFQMETGNIAGDTGLSGTGLDFSRAAWFGVGGGFGEVRLGRHFRPSVGMTGGQLTNFGWRGTSSQGNGVGLRGTIDSVGSAVSSRNSSAITYMTPNMSGFSAGVQYVLAADNANNSILDFALAYANGPIGASLGYIKTANAKADTAMGVSYDFGAAKVLAGYIDPAGAGKGFTLGVKAPIGAFTAGLEYTRNTATKVSGFELGGDYALSKRTALTALMNKTTNRQSGYFAGVRHAF